MEAMHILRKLVFDLEVDSFTEVCVVRHINE